MCEHRARRYGRGRSPAWGRKPGDPALGSSMTPRRVHPFGRGTGGGGRGGGTQGLPSGPSPDRVRPACQPKEAGLGLLLPGGSLASPPPAFRAPLTTLWGPVEQLLEV